MKKKTKQSDDSKIINAMDSVDKAVRILRKYGSSFDEYIDEAAIRGNDARAKQLIRQKIRVLDLVDQLTEVKSNITLGAYTSYALAELGKLPDAISACKGLLADSPDFDKLAKSLASIFSDISKSEQEIAKLNNALTTEPTGTIESILATDEPEKSERFNAEYAAMIERIKGRVAPESVAKPAADVDATGDIDYAGIVEDENKKR